MTLGQLDDYNFLRARLSRRYDPPEREEAHRAELRARMRRRNESADEFAENLKNLAQRAYTSADQNMLDNLVVERFREVMSSAQQQRATHRQKCNYDSKAVACAFPPWMLDTSLLPPSQKEQIMLTMDRAI